MASHGTEPLPVAPFSLDVLADLHAGALEDSVSARLWPLVEQDPRAMDVIAALDAVSSRLSEVGQSTPAGPVPPGVAERTVRTLADAAEASMASVTPLTTGRRAPRRAARIIVAAAAAVIVSAAVATTLLLDTSNPTSPPGVVAEAPAIVLDSSRLDSSVAYAVMANRGTVGLLESGRLPDCLAANGFDAASTVLGSAPIQLDGQPGFMLVLPRGGPAEGLTLLAVGTDCGVGEPQTLVRRDIS